MRFADLVAGLDNFVNRLGIVGVNVTSEVKELLDYDLRIPSGVLVAAKTSTLLGEGPQPVSMLSIPLKAFQLKTSRK
jgi:hypothetical protein